MTEVKKAAKEMYNQLGVKHHDDKHASGAKAMKSALITVACSSMLFVIVHL